VENIYSERKLFFSLLQHHYASRLAIRQHNLLFNQRSISEGQLYLRERRSCASLNASHVFAGPCCYMITLAMALTAATSAAPSARAYNIRGFWLQTRSTCVVI